jgi:pyocin large subunit-like protein
LRNSSLLIKTLFLLAFVSTAWGRGAEFRSKHVLDDQFDKHGSEFGRITKQQYVQMAQQLRDKRPGGSVVEARRPDGTLLRFDRKRGHFGVYDPDGTIRGFFVPPDGVRYFERQAKK